MVTQGDAVPRCRSRLSPRQRSVRNTAPSSTTSLRGGQGGSVRTPGCPPGHLGAPPPPRAGCPHLSRKTAVSVTMVLVTLRVSAVTRTRRGRGGGLRWRWGVKGDPGAWVTPLPHPGDPHIWAHSTQGTQTSGCPPKRLGAPPPNGCRQLGTPHPKHPYIWVPPTQGTHVSGCPPQGIGCPRPPKVIDVSGCPPPGD